MITQRQSLAALIAQLPPRQREPLLRAFESQNDLDPTTFDFGELFELLGKAATTAAEEATPLGYLRLAADILNYVGGLFHDDRAALRGQLEGLAGYEASRLAGQKGVMCGKCRTFWDPRIQSHVFGVGATPCQTVEKT